MNKNKLEEIVIRIDVKLKELKEDIQEIKELEKRLQECEKFNEKIKGWATAIIGAIMVAGSLLLEKIKVLLGL